MKKYILLAILILSFCNVVNSQPILNNKIDSISTSLLKINLEIDYLSKRMEIIEYDNSIQKGFVNQGTERISNEIEASNRTISLYSFLITILGIILGVVGVILGVYISRKEKEVRSLLDEVKSKKNEVEKLKKNVDETSTKMAQLNDEIHEDISGLYAKLRREETITLLDRLIEIPEDVGNIMEQLLSRPLENSDYNKLKIAYDKLEAECDEIDRITSFLGTTNRQKYLLLFIQHFLDQAILAPNIREYIINYFTTACNCAFKNDIIKSTKDLVKAINENNIENRNSEIVEKFLLGVWNSRHSHLRVIYQIIVNGLSNKHMLETIWDKLISEGIVIITFGDVLSETYNDDPRLVDKIHASMRASELPFPSSEQ